LVRAEDNSTADAASLAVDALGSGPDYDGVEELVLYIVDDARAPRDDPARGPRRMTVLLSDYTPMAPTLVREPLNREGWVYEEKVDGWRTARALVLDGEVAIYDEKLRSRFNWLREPDADAVATPPMFMVFDVLHQDGREFTGRPLRDRRAPVETLKLVTTLRLTNGAVSMPRLLLRGVDIVVKLG
jgi:ATP-dependent DNA ligase